MNQMIIYPETPERRFSNTQLSAVQISSKDEEMMMADQYSSAFKTPIANKIAPRSSPPPLCRERKRERQGSIIFEAQDGTALSQFLIPDFGGGEATSSPQRKPIKFCLKQRLSHPSFVQDQPQPQHQVIGNPPIHLLKTLDEKHSSRSSLRLSLSATNLGRIERPGRKSMRRSSLTTALSA